MKSLFLLAVGVVGGFAVAHQVNKTPRGQQFFGDLDGSVKSFRSAVVDGYRAREAELRTHRDES